MVRFGGGNNSYYWRDNRATKGGGRVRQEVGANDIHWNALEFGAQHSMEGVQGEKN